MPMGPPRPAPIQTLAPAVQVVNSIAAPGRVRSGKHTAGGLYVHTVFLQLVDPLRRVPVSPVPRLRRYYEGATTSRSRIPGPLWFRSQAPRMPPVFVVAAALLMSSEEFYQAWNTCSAGVPTRHVAYADACGISQVPWRSVLCLCPAPRPRPSRQDLRLGDLIDAALGPPRPKASTGT